MNEISKNLPVKQPETKQTPITQNNSKSSVWVVIILIIAATAGSGYWLYINQLQLKFQTDLQHSQNVGNQQQIERELNLIHSYVEKQTKGLQPQFVNSKLKEQEEKLENLKSQYNESSNLISKKLENIEASTGDNFLNQFNEKSISELLFIAQQYALKMGDAPQLKIILEYIHDLSKKIPSQKAIELTNSLVEDLKKLQLLSQDDDAEIKMIFDNLYNTVIGMQFLSRDLVNNHDTSIDSSWSSFFDTISARLQELVVIKKRNSLIVVDEQTFESVKLALITQVSRATLALEQKSQQQFDDAISKSKSMVTTYLTDNGQSEYILSQLDKLATYKIPDNTPWYLDSFKLFINDK